MLSVTTIEDFLSALYHALRAARRRYVIQFLQESDEVTHTTRDLARKIASLEQDVPADQATGEPYRNAYNALSQTHLPTLSDAGIIVYDSERQTVCRGTNFQIAAVLLDANAPTVDLFQSLLEEMSDDGDR
ncbi:DUF7344 domain-containing protein [Halorhabdus amylolytica]|uniref:DUF7344 domain-containing protein n=1 Tax=Halorhabdus amylolytica TaxID=2559573 RepID=UPI0010AAFE6B|nr:hypothetical protein [Halorhabdus amylolytica]